MDYFEEMNWNGTSIADITINSSANQSTIPYTITTTGTGPIITNDTWYNDSLLNQDNINKSLIVRGDTKIDGKLEVGGKDIGEVLDRIEKRLAILSYNKELEDRWNKLKEVGEEYRQLEQELLEQERIYKILSK